MLDNAAIAELLIREAETATGHRERALQRAAHAAFMWSEEAVDLVTAGRSLTELAGIGPSLAKRLHGWLDAIEGWRAVYLHPSSITGGDGNREFLLAGMKSL